MTGKTRRGSGWRALHVALISCLSSSILPLHPPIVRANGPEQLLLPSNQVAALAAEVSGLRAKDSVIGICRYHRVQASSGYDGAAQFVAERAKASGLDDVDIERFPADGSKMYYTLKSTPGWEAEAGELWETGGGRGKFPQKIADYSEMPVSLADYSNSADVTADLVDVGDGARPEDYKGIDVSGKIVLAGGPVADVHRMACGERGAEGIVSYQSNQVTGWTGDYPDIVRWGHLSPYESKNKFAFMISLRRARELKRRLSQGERIQLHAVVKASLGPSEYEVVTGVIPGTDLKDQEIVFSCHLCHEKPGANDDASGAAALLEIARTYITLIKRGDLPRPRRTIRFIWPPEINGTLAYFSAHRDEVKRMKAAIHLDMVGGDYRITKSVLHTTETPASLPSCVNSLAAIFTRYAVEGSERAAMDGDFSNALLSPTGNKDPLIADVTGYEMGSDQDVYEEGSFGIPTIYLRDWPDVFIHTSNDVPANIDPTKLKRSAFIAAACGYFLATAGAAEAERLAEAVFDDGVSRIPAEYQRALAAGRADPEGDDLIKRIVGVFLDMDQQALSSVRMLAPDDQGLEGWVDSLTDKLGGTWLVLTGQLVEEHKGKKVYFVPRTDEGSRDKKPRSRAAGSAQDDYSDLVPIRRVAGPMEVYYDNYVRDRVAPPDFELVSKLSSLPHGDIILYETLNLVDGKRDIQDIRDYLTAAYGPVPIEYIASYLGLLQRVGVVELQRKGAKQR